MRWYSPFAVLAAVLTSVPSIAGADTNVWTSLGPDGGYVLAIAINPQDSNTLYSATNSGISKTTNGGKSWNPTLNSGLPTLSVSNIVIDMQHPSTLYASATVGIFKSTDAGASWNSASSGLPVYGPGTYGYVSALAISPQDPNTLYAGLLSDTPGVFKSTDGGANWTGITAGLPAYISILVADAKIQGTVYAIASDQNGIFKTTNGGLSWTQLNIAAKLSYSFVALAIDPQDSNTLYASEGPAQGLC